VSSGWCVKRTNSSHKLQAQARNPRGQGSGAGVRRFQREAKSEVRMQKSELRTVRKRLETPEPPGEPGGAPRGAPTGEPPGAPRGASGGAPGGGPTGEPPGAPRGAPRGAPTGEPPGAARGSTQGSTQGRAGGSTRGSGALRTGSIANRLTHSALRPKQLILSLERYLANPLQVCNGVQPRADGKLSAVSGVRAVGGSLSSWCSWCLGGEDSSPNL
jgi:hypothetical protein